MASIGHIAVGILAGRISAQHPTAPSPYRLMLALSALSLLPDADVIAFALHIPYEAPWGHRGASHSLVFAMLVAAAVTALWPALGRERRGRWFLIVLGVIASHGLLDALTDGGLGAALMWPWSDARYFAPWRPLPVAPIGRGLLSARGIGVMALETLVFLPLLAYGLWPRKHRGD